jgi:hypothetical protein
MDTENEQDTLDGIEETVDEFDTIKQRNEYLTQELTSRDAENKRLEQALEAKNVELNTLKQSFDETSRTLDEVSRVIPQAVGAYRELVIQSNPGLLAELITGDSIEEVNGSLKKARAIVERVRQEIEVEAAKARIPAGAPQRTPMDFSGLSPREKIQYAIGGK